MTIVIDYTAGGSSFTGAGIPVQDIFDRVTDLLLDKDRSDDEARWINAELFRWLNDSRMAILTRRPQAGAVIETVSLVAGSLQTVPDNAVMFIDAIRNMASDGTTPGRVIRRTDRQNLDDDDLYWHKLKQKGEISQFSFDDRTPRRYYVYPPAIDGTKIEISYARNPNKVSTLGDTLELQPEYIDAVVNYVCYRAKAKDSQYANAGEAAAYFGAFNDALGVQTASQNAASPNQPGNSV